MMSLDAEEIIKKIIEEKGLTREEIEKEIGEKIKKFNNLITKAGAAHIIANELGVNLYKTEGVVKIKELNTFSKNVIINVKVIKKYDSRSFSKEGKEGKVANFLVGDETGVRRLVLWNDQVDRYYDKVKENDIIQIKNPFIRVNNDRLEIQVNKNSEIIINPENININIRKKDRELKYIKDLEDGVESEIMGTIIHIYDPKFFEVCPECGKKTIDEKCPVHGLVKSEKRIVTNIQLDDGTGSIRITLWKETTEKLFEKKLEELDEDYLNKKKHELLGEFVKVIGTPKNNEQFNRLEFNATNIIKNIDPEEEIKRFENDKNEEKEKRIIENKKNEEDNEENEGNFKDEEIIIKPNLSLEEENIEEEIINIDDLEED